MCARPTAFALLAALALPACLAPPRFPDLPDGGARTDAALPELALVALRIEDARGTRWPADAVPRQPVLQLEFSTPPFGTEGVLLLTGAPDAELLEDLDAAPLRASTLARAIEVQTALEGAVLTLTPVEPLAAGAALTIAIPRTLESADGGRLPAARAEALHVSTAPSAGARATDSWPPDGAFDVAPELALAAIRFDGAVEAPSRAVVLRDATGHALEASAEVVACSSVGWSTGTCVSLVPMAPLAPSAAYVLAVAPTARDASGALLPAFEARFTTATSAPGPLTTLAPSCALGETLMEDVCTRADDESISVHGQLSAAALVRWTLETQRGALVTPRGALALRIGDLVEGRALVLGIDAIDYAGRTTALSLPLTTTEPLPRLAITEIRADPFGPEPRQEYVEIANEGPTAISLEGMSLAERILEVLPWSRCVALTDLLMGDEPLAIDKRVVSSLGARIAREQTGDAEAILRDMRTKKLLSWVDLPIEAQDWLRGSEGAALLSRAPQTIVNGLAALDEKSFARELGWIKHALPLVIRRGDAAAGRVVHAALVRVRRDPTAPSRHAAAAEALAVFDRPEILRALAETLLYGDAQQREPARLLLVGIDGAVETLVRVATSGRAPARLSVLPRGRGSSDASR